MCNHPDHSPDDVVSGLGRWHSPRVYPCAHTGCPEPARVLVRAGAHDVDEPDARHGDGSTPRRTHNCCGGHAPDPAPGGLTRA